MDTNFEFEHIFLADDDPDDCDFFSEALQMLFPEVQLTVAHNGQRLIDTLTMPSNQLPDIIFLDLNMPLLSGIECLKKIRSHHKLKDCVVVILTTASHYQDIVDLYKLGANFFVTKPTEFSALPSLINKAIVMAQNFGRTQPPMADFVIF